MYFTNQDLAAELTTVNLTRVTGGDTIDYDVVNNARANAEALVNSYLNGRYPVPFEGEIDPIVKKISIDLAIVNLYENDRITGILPDTVKYRRNNAIALLEKLQKGDIIMQNYAASKNAPPAIYSNAKEKRIFNKDLLDDFIASV